MRTWNMLSTWEQVVPRNEHVEFKGISYGLPTRNTATTVLRLKHDCIGIGIEPPIVLIRMPTQSSSSHSEAQPGTTPKAPPASCVPLDHKKSYMDQMLQGPEEADYTADNVDASPLMLPQSAKMGNSNTPDECQRLDKQRLDALWMTTSRRWKESSQRKWKG